MDKAETLALYAEGRIAWNAWAARMLVARKALEEKGEWIERVPVTDAAHAWVVAALADFTGHSFMEAVHFDHFVFPGIANFSEAAEKDEAGKDISVPTRFESDASFCNATFSGDAIFFDATFSGSAVFDDATFSGDAWFRKATFSEHAQFLDATFSGSAVFDGVTFSGNAIFDGATFSGFTRFDVKTFSKIASFDLARFDDYTTFKSARFENAASFIAIKGESFFSLRDVTFNETPDFEQAHFAEAPRLDASRYADKAEPSMTARWRALKRLAVQGHDHEREQLFFAQELKSLRGESDWLVPRLQNLLRPGEPVWGNWARYLLGLLYQWCSDFGRSMVRPVVWWGVLTSVFALVYLDQHLPYKAPPYPARLNVWAARDYTPPLECVVGKASAPLTSAIFLAIHKGLVGGLGGSEKLAQTYACLYGEDQSAPVSRRQIIPDAVAFAGFVQAVFSAPLIFLFLLAVRNHFRIK